MMKKEHWIDELMDPATRDHWCELFATEITDRETEIDESEEQDWYSLSLGWALGKGLSVDESHALSIYLRYTLQYLRT